jgi:hypothetical protein
MKVRGNLIVVITLLIAGPVTAQGIPDSGQTKVPKTLPVSLSRSRS